MLIHDDDPVGVVGFSLLHDGVEWLWLLRLPLILCASVPRLLGVSRVCAILDLPADENTSNLFHAAYSWDLQTNRTQITHEAVHLPWMKGRSPVLI